MMKRESDHLEQFPTLCILSGFQCQISVTVIFFQNSLHIVGSILCSSLKKGKDQLSVKITGQRLWILNFIIPSLVTLGKSLYLLGLSFPT